MVKVLKFGGTSVGSAENMRKAAEIIISRQSTVTVLSAMSGTTDMLVKISSAAAGGNASSTEQYIDALTKKYSECIEKLLLQHKAEALNKVEETFKLIHNEVVWFTPEVSEKKIIAQGELLTTAIFSMYMQEQGYQTVLLHAPSFMHTDSEGKVDTAKLESELSKLTLQNNTYYITQGFICTNANGEIDNLGRGGSDYSAALIGAALNADQVEVWTDIDGIHNNDPRVVENTHPIPYMSFDEAAELAYFGAKILHPATIQPCKDKNIPVYLKDTLDPEAFGTIISNNENNDAVFKAVAAKDNITVIRIYSARMLMAYGFLRKVFEIFEEYRTSIDMITTSEVAVSLTVDSDLHLDEICEKLKSLGSIEVEHNNSIICVVGNLEHDKNGLAAQVFDSIQHIPVKMISYGASHRSITLLSDSKNKKEILQSLNETLFKNVK